jgi:hypothetical protein
VKSRREEVERRSEGGGGAIALESKGASMSKSVRVMASETTSPLSIIFRAASRGGPCKGREMMPGMRQEVCVEECVLLLRLVLLLLVPVVAMVAAIVVVVAAVEVVVVLVVVASLCGPAGQRLRGRSSRGRRQ